MCADFEEFEKKKEKEKKVEKNHFTVSLGVESTLSLLLLPTAVCSLPLNHGQCQSFDICLGVPADSCHGYRQAVFIPN